MHALQNTTATTTATTASESQRLHPSFHDVAAGFQWNRTISPGANVTIARQSAVGPKSITSKEHARPAKISVTQQASPNAISARNGLVTYIIVAQNHGRGGSNNTMIQMPFDPTISRLVDAHLSNLGGWVSKVLTNSIEIYTGGLSSDDIITTTGRYVVRP